MRNLTTRLFIILLTIIHLTSPTFAQSEQNPVSWTFEYTSVNNSSTEYELRFIANIFPNWYIYSQSLERPPIPTSFAFEENTNNFMMIGDIEEDGDLIVKYDDIFEKDIKKYADKVVFKSKIVIGTNKTFQIKGHLEYMTCNSSTCNPPAQVEFIFEIEPNENAPVISEDYAGDFKAVNSPDYSFMDAIHDGGMVINVPEGPVDIRPSNGKIYKETNIDVALTGSENIVNEDKEEVIDDEDGDLLVAANISNYLKKKKKKKSATLANRTIIKKKSTKKPKVNVVQSPVKWDFELEKGEKNQYYLVFKPNVQAEWTLSENLPKVSFDNSENIVLVDEKVISEITENGTLFKQAVKFKENRMLTGKLSYSLKSTEDKTLEREASFAFNQSGDVATYQSKAGWWIGSGISLVVLTLLTLALIWRRKKTLVE